MLGTLRTGLCLAVLAMAAGELRALGRVLADCASSLQGCDVDEQSDEPKGLDLLQIQTRLQSDPAQTVPAAAHADAQLGVMKSRVFAKVSGHAHTFASWLEVRTAANQSLNEGAHLLAVLVSGSACKAVGTGVGVFIFILCGGLAAFRRSCSGEVVQQSSSQENSTNAESRAEGLHQLLRSRSESPPMQKLLPTAPHSNLRLSPRASPVPSRHSPIASPAISDLGLAILPPICPSLIMPHTEARCFIPIDVLRTLAELDTQIEQFDILGTSGRKLLLGTLSKTPEGRRYLALASCGCAEDRCVTLLAPPSHSQQGRTPHGLSGIMELYGKNGKFYGTLEPASRAAAMLRCDGEFVMSMEIKNNSDLSMSAASMDGRVLGSAGKNLVQGRSSRNRESKDMWTLQVTPNFDAVLIAACMLGALIFN